MLKNRLLKITDSKELNLLINIVALVFTIGSAVYSYMSLPKIDLCYADQPEVTLTTCRCIENKLRIYWENERIYNLKIKRLAFWNNGTQYIDNQLLKKDIHVLPTTKCHILSLANLKISRDNLKLSFKPCIKDITVSGIDRQPQTFESETIHITIPPKESLERNDGAKFDVLYSSQDSCFFSFYTEVKGKSPAFRYIDTYFSYFFHTKVELSIILFLLIPYFIALKNIFFPSLNLYEYLHKKYNKHSLKIDSFYRVSIITYKIIFIPLLGWGIIKLTHLIYNINSFPNWMYL